MAVAISGENRCEYCVASHKRYLKDLTGDPVLPEVLAANPGGRRCPSACGPWWTSPSR
jgi:AhpD family alkylhydroperoxidase